MADPKVLAERLLDAQVQFVLDELTGDTLVANIARDVDDVLAVAETLVVADTVDQDAVKQTARELVDQIGAGPIIAPMASAFSDAIYDLAANEKYHLGDVVDREPVVALFDQLLGMHTLHNRALDRLTESPLVANVASSFVNKIVSDFLASNREKAERLPGMGALLSVGDKAAARVRKATDRHLDQFIGDVAGRGAQYALKRTNNAIRELIRDAPLHEAAMELWDLHADEPIAGLREYLSRQEQRELVEIVHRIAETARNTEYFGHVLDECIDVFYERYGSHTVASLLPEVGLSRDQLIKDIRTYAPPIVEAAKRDGALANLIRQRLEPFFLSDSTLAILEGAPEKV